jgi:hypothetical protein
MSGPDELRELWESQPSCGETKGEDIMALVQKKMRCFDRAIAVRNLLECLAGGAVMVFFGWQGLRAHDVLMRTGSLVVTAGGAWIIYYLLRYGNKSVSADPSQNLMGYTRALVERYDHQIRLLKSVKYWYLLPMYVGLVIISMGLLLQRAKTGSLGWRDFGGPAFYTAVFVVVWWLNEVVSVGRLRKERAQLLGMTSQNGFTGSKQ